MGCLKFRKKFTIKSAAATFKVANVVCYTCKKCFLKRVAGFPLKCDENRKSEIKFKETYEGAKLNWNGEPDDRANEPTLIFEFGKTLRLEKRYFLFQIELEYTFGNAQSDESRDEGSLRFIPSDSKVKSRRDRKKPGWNQKFGVFLGWLISLFWPTADFMFGAIWLMIQYKTVLMERLTNLDWLLWVY